jgi:hypothetical protein
MKFVTIPFIRNIKTPKAAHTLTELKQVKANRGRLTSKYKAVPM